MNEKILIVDDDPLVVMILGRMLSGAGFRTWTASGADQALALAGQEDFDVIMLDLVLRGASGYSVIDPLKRISRAAILAMSGNADTEIEKDVMMLGADGLIGKPFELQRLASTLREMAGKAS